MVRKSSVQKAHTKKEHCEEKYFEFSNVFSMFPNSFYPMPAVSFKSKPNNFYHLIAYESITITPKKIREGVLYNERKNKIKVL